MLLALSDTYTDTLALLPEDTVQCDLTLSEAVCAAFPKEGPCLFTWLCETLPAMWPHLMVELSDNPWIQQVRAGKQDLGFGVVLVTNAEIQDLNRTFRAKNSATDVLTFSLLEEASEGVDRSQLPELNLGEVYLSLDWAREAICNEIATKPKNPLNFWDGLTLYLIERLIHGALHLLGVHHDTMADYNKVVAIQRTVIHALSEETTTLPPSEL